MPIKPIFLYLLGATFLPLKEASPLGSRSVLTNQTIKSSKLQTWWHDTGEINTETAVKPQNVRQSHAYSVQVSSSLGDLDGPYYDSFVYETIPRNGNGNILVPGDPTSKSTQDDSVTIENDVGINMAWTQFLYSIDVWIKISRLGGNASTRDNVVIRPTTLNYTISESNGDIYIRVPYVSQGTRFSVEFQDNLYSYRDSCATPICDYVQDVNPTGTNYVESFGASNPVMSVEPKDALLIFASPFLSTDMIPDSSANTSLVVEPGLVTDLDIIDKTTVIFNPGVYYFTGTAHAQLSSSVNWVYFSAGAYVKGAIQYSTTATEIKGTGHGVLSGEQYVYQANPSVGYTGQASNGDCLRMWSGISTSGSHQTFIVNGVTVNAPPFNSMDFTGDLDTLSVDAFDYKQVGAWFGQTDGMENYPGSHVRDIFYHSNDDTIKVYYSNVLVERIVVWKGKTAPTVQFGWASRTLNNITVDHVDIIHSGYSSNGSHPSLFGANQVYPVPETQTNTAVLTNTVSNLTFSNFRSEGLSGDLFRIVPLANFENILIDNVSIDSFSVPTDGIHVSEFPIFTDANGKPVTIENFVIKEYYVGGTKVSMAENNYDAGSLGGLNIPPALLQPSAVTVI